MSDVNQRELVLDILLAVEQRKEYSNIALQQTLQKYQYMDKQIRSFITKVAEGTLENRICIDYRINQFSKVKVSKMKPVVRNVLRMSVYQMTDMDAVPVSAICNEAVKLTRKRGFSGLSGFVNGVLRNIARNLNQVTYPDQEKNPLEYLSVVYSMPLWILEGWMKDYDLQTIEIMVQALGKERPTTIRVNTSNISVEQCKKHLEGQGIVVEPGDYIDTALKISNYNYMNQIDGFEEGYFAVQDESSMMVSKMANPSKDMHVLDVCAAPGGKALHMADLLQGTGKVIARDVSDYKVQKIEDNLNRYGFTNVELQVQDALQLTEETIEWADVVIADLPCSGLGIMGRKKDIKYNMTEEAQKELSQLQRKILQVVHQYVKPGGLLMYSTCTINKEENENNVQWFTEHFPFRLEEQKQFLPGIDSCDGFFIAKLRRE
jgi:16S rRNA (cytosine967-C5)-methyltransferase